MYAKILLPVINDLQGKMSKFGNRIEEFPLFVEITIKDTKLRRAKKVQVVNNLAFFG